LANIALHGVERETKNRIQSKYGIRVAKSLTIIRYADDICAVHPDLAIILEVKDIIGEVLGKVGLEYSESKTKILHTLQKVGENRPGFDYLGFKIQ